MRRKLKATAFGHLQAGTFVREAVPTLFFLACIAFMPSCSGGRSSGPQTLRVGDNLATGQRHILRGTVGKDREVLLLSQVDKEGNEMRYVAELYDSKESRVSLPSEGTKMIFDGILRGGAQITGSDYSYKPDGSRTETRARILQFDDCHVR